MVQTSSCSIDKVPKYHVALFMLMYVWMTLQGLELSGPSLHFVQIQLLHKCLGVHTLLSNSPYSISSETGSRKR